MGKNKKNCGNWFDKFKKLLTMTTLISTTFSLFHDLIYKISIPKDSILKPSLFNKDNNI